MRTWRLEVPPEPEGVTCVRDEDGRGDLWRKVDGSWYFVIRWSGVLSGTPLSWDSIVTEFGPLVEVICECAVRGSADEGRLCRAHD